LHKRLTKLETFLSNKSYFLNESLETEKFVLLNKKHLMHLHVLALFQEVSKATHFRICVCLKAKQRIHIQIPAFLWQIWESLL